MKNSTKLDFFSIGMMFFYIAEGGILLFLSKRVYNNILDLWSYFTLLFCIFLFHLVLGNWLKKME